MKNLFEGGPPLVSLMRRKRLLHGIGMGPPLACFRVLRHLRHVGCEIITNILEIGKEEVIMPKNRVVANIAGVNSCQYLRPDLSMHAFVILDALRLDPDKLPKTAHTVSPLYEYFIEL